MDDDTGLTPQQSSRRRFLRQAATVTWATPFILTMTAPRAAAQSCLPTGTSCGNYMEIAGIGPVCQPLQGAALCCGDCLPVPQELACRCSEL